MYLAGWVIVFSYNFSIQLHILLICYNFHAACFDAGDEDLNTTTVFSNNDDHNTKADLQPGNTQL